MTKQRSSAHATFSIERRYDAAPDRVFHAFEDEASYRRWFGSLGVIEIAPQGRCARLTFTEHGAFLDGHDGLEERREGTAEGLEQLGRWLERPAMAV